MAPSPSDGFGPGAFTTWRLGRVLGSGVFRFMWNLEVSGPPPPSGPKVVAANHFSFLDPVMVGKAVGPVRYLALDELFGKSRFFDALTLWMGAIPLSRVSTPLSALRTALEYLDESGGAVGVFPEGRRVWTWGEEAPKAGGAWLALRAGVPLVPVAISGTDQALGRGDWDMRRWPVRVAVCPPLHPEAYLDAERPPRAMIDDWAASVGAALSRLRRASMSDEASR